MKKIKDEPNLFSDEQITSVLESVISHDIFRQSPSVKKFLSYVVSEKIANPKASFKGYTIAVNAFGKSADFDPQDPYIRNIAREVRRSLNRYYQLESLNHPLRIEIPLGSYAPRFLPYENDEPKLPAIKNDYSELILDSKLEPTIAVIPFKGLVDGSAASMYGELIANELIMKFSQSAEFQVISLLSTLSLGGSNDVIARAKTDLKADYVVFGTYVEAHGDLRVSMQLIEVRTQIVTHASLVNVSLKDISMGISDLGERLISEVRGSIFDQEYRRAIENHPLSLESFTLKIAAMRLMHRISKDDLQRSKQLLTVLCEKNPKLAEPHALMGHWHILNHNQGLGSSNNMVADSAQRCVDRALNADEDCSLALTINAVVSTNFRRDFDSGEILFRKALESNPSNALAWLLKGTMHTFKGEGDLAVSHTRKAVKLSPLDPQKYYYDSLLASAELVAGNYDQALAAIESSYKLNKYHASTLRVRTMLLSILGEPSKAADSGKELLELMPHFTVSAYRKNLPVTGTALVDICAKALLDAGIPP